MKERKRLADGSIKEYSYEEVHLRRSISLTFISQKHKRFFMDKMERALKLFEETHSMKSMKSTNVIFLDKLLDVYLHQMSWQSLPNQETAMR